jgi:ribonuclease BN (tRNA processing enzyme)
MNTMKYLGLITASLVIGIASIGEAHPALPGCSTPDGVTLQILGSGGPIADDGRASTAYLLWINGRARLMVDTGGGTFLRFGEAGARFKDLSHIAISHFHTDHSADLVALLKSGYFSGRTSKLSVSGPSTGGPYPGLNEYLDRLLGPDKGAYAYLAGYIDGSDGLVKLETSVVDPKQLTASRVYSDPDDDLEIFAISVPHGPVPTLAYRVRIGSQSIVFAGDQNGSSEAFIDFARGTDVLVMHMPVPEGIDGVARRLHAPPSVIGDIATATGAGKLVLSHFMARRLGNIEHNLEVVRSRYSGPVVSSNDLECVELINMK